MRQPQSLRLAANQGCTDPATPEIEGHPGNEEVRLATRRFATILGVHPQEVTRVTALVVSSFFLGAALVCDYTASNTLFLTAFNISTLPYMYIVNAVLTIVFGILYVAIQKRVPFDKLLYITNNILAGIVFLCWLVLRLTGSPAVIFLNMAMFRLIFIFTTLGIWELAGAAFDIQQAKRLFSLIGLGLMSAYVIGGLLTPIIVKYLEIENVLLLAVVFMLMYSGILMRMLPRMGIQKKHRAQPDGSLSLKEMFGDSYVRRILGLKTCSMLVAYVVEYIFYQQAAAHFPSQTALANFLGIFIGSATLVMVLVAALAAGRYISHFGIKIALPTMPVAMVVTSLASALYGIVAGTGGIFFGLVASIMYANQILEKSIYTPTMAVLYQPLPPERRILVRVTVEGWFGSVALILSGVLLLIFGWLPGRNIVSFVFLLLAIAIAFVFLANSTYRGYAMQLQQAVKARFVSGVALSGPNSLNAGQLLEQLRSEHPGNVLAALYYLDTIKNNPAAPFLVDLLKHPSPYVQMDALQRIAAYRFRQALGGVIRLMERPGISREVRGQAVFTRMALQGELGVEYTASLLSSDVAEQAILGLLRYGGEKGSALARQKLESLAKSTRAEDQVLAGHILAQTTSGGFGTLVIALLNSTQQDVRQAAIEAAGRHFQPAFGETLLNLLAEPQHCTAAQRALGLGGESSATLLIERFDTIPTGLRPDVVLALGATQASIAIRFIEAQLEQPHSSVPLELRHAILQSLRRAAYRTAANDMVIRQLELETQIAHWILEGLQTGLPDLLQRAFTAEMNAVRQRVNWLLAFLDEKLENLPLMLSHPNPDQRASTLAMLEDTLPPRIRKLACPLLAELSPAEQLALLPRQTETHPVGAEFLQAIAEQSSFFNNWTCTCAKILLFQSHNQQVEATMLTLIEKVILLRSVGIFAQTPDAVLAEIAGILHERRAAKGETLMHKGEMDNTMYLIVSGQVRVHDGDLTIAERREGEIVGELAVLDPAPRAASVTALTDCHFFVLDRETLFELIDARPEVINGILKVLVGRLREQVPTAPLARD